MSNVADHVARAPAARHREALYRDSQPGALEDALHQRVGAALRPAGCRPRAGARDSGGEAQRVVGCGARLGLGRRGVGPTAARAVAASATSATAATASRVAASFEQLLQLGGLGHGRLAGEALAHVGGGPAVHGGAAREQRHAVRLARRPARCGGESATARRARARSCRRPPARPLAWWREVEVERLEQVREGLGMAARNAGAGAGTRRPPGARTRARRSARPAAAVRSAALAFPDGIGWSSGSLRRATRRSWSRRGLEEAAALLVGEPLDHRVGQSRGRRRTSAARSCSRTG